MEVYSSSSHPLKKRPGYLPFWGGGGELGQRALGRSGTVDWLCLGPAQQRSCIASWGCGPSSRGPDLTIPPCGCHRMAMGSVLCPPRNKKRILPVVSFTAGAWCKVAAHRRRQIAGNGSSQSLRSCRSISEYFALRWQPRTSLALSNNLVSFCQNLPTSSKVKIGKKKKKEKNHPSASFNMTTCPSSLTLSICRRHCIELALHTILIKINCLSILGQMPVGACARQSLERSALERWATGTPGPHSQIAIRSSCRACYLNRSSHNPPVAVPKPRSELQASSLTGTKNLTG